jgi:peptide/nickel transport system permease protein
MAVALDQQRLAQEIAPQTAGRSRALRRVLRTKVTVIGIVLVTLLVSLAVAAPLIVQGDPNAMDVMARTKPPLTPGHPLGTDTFGRDIFKRVVLGSQISLFIAITVVTISSLIGTLLGVLTGYMGGVVDTVISRVWDVIFSFPGILLFLLIMGILGPGIWMSVIAITIGSIPGYGRLVRERVLSQRTRPYVEAARVIGARPSRIMFRHVLPNSLTPLLVSAALSIPGVIGAEAGLSYLGLGVPPPYPSWGKMIAEGQPMLLTAPWIALVPGAFILLATLGFNLVGDGLRDYFDPTQLR